jgi:hypothetical protein
MAIKLKCPTFPQKGVLLLHDNTWPHSAMATQLLQFLQKILEHSVHSPELAPSISNLFLALKVHLGGHLLQIDDNVETTVK